MLTDKPVNSDRIFIIIIAMTLCYMVSYFALTWVIDDKAPAYSNVVYHVGKDTYNLPVQSADSLVLKNTPSPAAPGLHVAGGLFNRNPVFLVWTQLILIMVSLAFGACLVFWWQAKYVIQKYHLTRPQVWKAIGLALFLCIILGFIPNCSNLLYLPDHVIKDFGILFANTNVPGIVVGVTLGFVLPVIVVIFLLVPASDDIPGTNTEKPNIEESAGRLDSLNKVLTSALQTLAVVVVFSVLTSGALRESIKATIHIPYFDIFPRQESYVYGIYFSSFLAIIYVPVQLLLKQRSHTLKADLDTYAKKTPVPDDKWLKEMDGIISNKNSALDNMKLTFTVLSPLITSFLPELMKLK